MTAKCLKDKISKDIKSFFYRAVKNIEFDQKHIIPFTYLHGKRRTKTKQKCTLYAVNN